MNAGLLEVHEIGRDAVLVEVAGCDEALSLAHHVRSVAPAVASEVVPGACTVLFDGIRDHTSLRILLDRWTPGLPTGVGPSVELVTTYDGADLAVVAQAWGTDTPGVVSLHQGIEFVAAFCGFAPGFVYLSGLPRHLTVPRRASPRSRVPAGAVALADAWCGVYPAPSPGGWQLIGRTAATLWDVTRGEPALLAPGTRVRFVRA